jgi:hypothetical protein
MAQRFIEGRIYSMPKGGNEKCRKKGRGAFLEKTVKRDSNGVN